MAWRASSGGGGAWLLARREVQSTDGAHGGVGGVVPWLEVLVCVEGLLGGNGSGRSVATMGGSSTSRRARTVVNEVVVEEVAGDSGGGLALRADPNKKQHCEGEEKQVDLASSMMSRRG
jgi:hypothetical protein